MRKLQKNEIVNAIHAVGLDPRQFDLEDGDGQFCIKHKWTLSCFTIRSKGMYDDASYVVGDSIEWPINECSWQTILPRISGWLKEVKSDLETPDLWADLQREARLLDATFEDVTENTLFTLVEQNEIKTRVQALAEHMRRTYSLSAPQMQAMDAKLDYLIEAARFFGRKDWLILCAGAIFGYIIIALLPPEAAHDMFLSLLRAVGHLYGQPPELPTLLAT